MTIPTTESVASKISDRRSLVFTEVFSDINIRQQQVTKITLTVT
jgi:hypothetical protein